MIWNLTLGEFAGIILMLMNFSAEKMKNHRKAKEKKSCWSNSRIHAHTNFVACWWSHLISFRLSSFTTLLFADVFTATKTINFMASVKEWKMEHNDRKSFFCRNLFSHLYRFSMYRLQSMEICCVSPLRKIVFSSLVFRLLPPVGDYFFLLLLWFMLAINQSILIHMSQL